MIGEKIKQHRTRQRISVRELAEMTNSSKSGIYQWEKGITDITAKKLIEVCKALNITSKDILGV